MPHSLEELATIAFEVATEAAELLLAGFRKHPAVTEKARADLVTDFDLASERLIRQRLTERTPEIAIVAEEQGGVAAPGAGRTWFCDPLDGTTNFVHGHPFFCVSIGLGEAGQPVAGAVVAPALGTHWLGFRGGPTLRNGEACRVSQTSELGHALVGTGFPSDRSRSPSNNFDAFVRIKQRLRGVRRCGSAAIDLCLVADGTYDAYWERRLNAWDVMAGSALVLAAGGELSALDGTPPDLSVGHILASNGRVHRDLLALLVEPPPG
ncbi:MAG TPA: inositol monophosphatase family protein [Polyangiaceae bacterium]|jgi:myo-inositol-1(or 4)-monophosphatase|nr:inositol monophosphatase family protein [Polyangiaceae bacterium]